VDATEKRCKFFKINKHLFVLRQTVMKHIRVLAKIFTPAEYSPNIK